MRSSTVFVAGSRLVMYISFFTSRLPGGTISYLFSGQFSSVSFRKDGPFNQRSFLTKSSISKPLLASLAGLILPEQCLHWSECANSLISVTLLASEPLGGGYNFRDA